jgi:hypothetical protein
MAEFTSTEYEQGMRQTDAQSDHQHEYDKGQVANGVQDFNPSTLLTLIAGSRANTSARERAMLNGQHTYGNRAVQRFVQRMATSSPHSVVGTLAVQRYRGPDWDWTRSVIDSGASGAAGMLGALPGVGNLFNASLGAMYLGMGNVATLTGDKAGEKRAAHLAQNSFLNAIPIFGNARSFGQGLHDQGAFYDNLFGGRSTPAELSADRYARESGPKFDDFLSSLF